MANKNTQNQDNRKFILIVVALLLVVAFIAISIWQGTANFAKWFPKQEQQQTEDDKDKDKDSGFISPGEHEANGISFKAMSIPVAQYNDYGVSAVAETAVQLTVTVTPANADVSDGKFSIEFKNASSAWANGKTLSEYVTLNQSDSTHATVSCLKAFGEQIIVTYTVTGENGNVTADYPLDYAKRIVSAGLEDSNQVSLTDSLNLLELNSLSANNYYLTATITSFSDYTVDDTFTIASTSTFKLTESFKSACSTNGVTLPGANKTGTVSDEKLNATDGSTSIFEYYFGNTYKTEAFRQAISSVGQLGIFQIEVTMQGTHSSYTMSYTLHMAANNLPVAAQGAQFQDNGHIF